MHLKKKKRKKKLAISSEAVKEKTYRDYGLCLLLAPGYMRRSIQNERMLSVAALLLSFVSRNRNQIMSILLPFVSILFFVVETGRHLWLVSVSRKFNFWCLWSHTSCALSKAVCRHWHNCELLIKPDSLLKRVFPFSFSCHVFDVDLGVDGNFTLSTCNQLITFCRSYWSDTKTMSFCVRGETCLLNALSSCWS